MQLFSLGDLDVPDLAAFDGSDRQCFLEKYLVARGVGHSVDCECTFGAQHLGQSLGATLARDLVFRQVVENEAPIPSAVWAKVNSA